jgi:hypothetical protein
LHRQVATHFAPLLSQPPARQQRGKAHKRGERHQVWVSQWALVDAGADWPSLKMLVCQQTTRWVAGDVQQATRYFLSSLAGASAATLAGYIRGHWSIENQQHWHLDMTFAEDVGKGAVEGLTAEDGKLDFGPVEPRAVDGGVDDFHPLQVRPGHVGGKWS